MIRNIITLTLNDVAIAFKNKTIFLIIFIPVFVFLSLKLVDIGAADGKKITIGLIQNESYAPVILKSLTATDHIFSVTRVSNEAEGKKQLAEKNIDGLLVRSGKDPTSVVLVVLKRESLQTLSIVESCSALQRAVEGKSTHWIADVSPLQEGGIQKQTLPTWVLMLVLLVGFIIMPAQVAEEKEKNCFLLFCRLPCAKLSGSLRN